MDDDISDHDRTTRDVTAQLADLRLTTQADVQTLWELLMHPLGFASTSVWVCFVDERGAPLPQLVQVSDDGEQRSPTTDELDALVGCLGHVVREPGDVAGLALLLSRPGRSGLTDDDLRVAADLLHACRAAGIPCHPVHVADDTTVMAVTPDDLAA